MRRRHRPTATLDDVVEVLHGIGVILMARQARIAESERRGVLRRMFS